MSALIVYHHNDADGRCAAAIMAQWGRNKGFVPEFVEMDYKDAVDINRITSLDSVAVVDFSFKPGIMAEVRKAACKGQVIWCDHHVTAKDYGYEDLRGIRDFSDKGLSGCECTWKFCFPDCALPRAVQLIGDYDAWRLDFQPECFEFYEGLKLQPMPPGSQGWDGLLGFQGECQHVAVQNILERGKTAIDYRNNYCANLRKSFGYETEIDGYQAYALNAYMFGSQGYGEKFKEFPVCIAYIHDGQKFTVSLYSGTTDVSVIAKAHGGGGHKGAAGFICQELPWRRASRPCPS